MRLVATRMWTAWELSAKAEELIKHLFCAYEK